MNWNFETWGIKEFAMLVGWLAFILNVIGNWQLTKIGNKGHLIRLSSNACWLFYSPFVGAWALFFNHLTFAFINVVGFYRWRRLEQEGRLTPHTEKKNE